MNKSKALCVHCGKLKAQVHILCEHCGDSGGIASELELALTQDYMGTEELTILGLNIEKINKYENGKTRRLTLIQRYLQVNMPGLKGLVVDPSTVQSLDCTLDAIGLMNTRWKPGYKNGAPNQSKFWFNIGMISFGTLLVMYWILRWFLRHL